MPNTKTCSSCQNENAENATVCVHCGAPLVTSLPPSTTIRVPQPPSKTPYPKRIVELTQTYSDALILQILGHEEPILVRGSTKIIIGRFSAGDTPPTIDLNPYNGAMFGISRHHAQISRFDDAYTIQDLGSTNGTWINETKLTPRQPHPLKNGDLVRMGQLGAYVYFHVAPSTSIPVEESLVLKYRSDDTDVLNGTVKNWSNTIMPYLNALAELQAVCDQIQERRPADVIIREVNVDSEADTVKVTLSGANEALLQLRDKILHWRTQYSAIEMPEGASNGAVASQTVQPNPSIEDLYDSLSQFSLQLVMDLSPQLETSLQKGFAEKLAPIIRVLALSPLQLA